MHVCDGNPILTSDTSLGFPDLTAGGEGAITKKISIASEEELLEMERLLLHQARGVQRLMCCCVP